MKLTDLDPHFLRVTGAGQYERVEMLTEAQGVCFTCPQCRGDKSHGVCVWFAERGAPDDEEPSARWGATGTSLEDLTIHPSVHVAGCWHGWVRSGEVS